MNTDPRMKFPPAPRPANPANPLRISTFGFRFWSLPLIALLLVSGCTSLFKPDPSVARHFILTPVDTPAPVAPPIALGVGRVKIPAYLYEQSFAMRQGTNEITYQPLLSWAERLDTGIQRVLAADLAMALPADPIRLSAWRHDEVTVGLYLTVDQFETDTRGHAVLAARWRLVSPDGQLLKTGQTRLTADGPAPAADAQGAVATLSRQLGELGRAIAQSIRDLKPTPP